MALTAYQTQFKQRMKRAISLRAKADRKARRYTQLLTDAIGAAEDAATQMNALNQLYNVDVSTYTLLTQALHANSGQEVLKDHLAQSTPGEEAVIFNQVPDANGGQLLPANPLFGEVVTSTPITAPEQTAKALAVKTAPVLEVLPATEAPTTDSAAPSLQETVSN
ncbi:hypothetical protein [Hymenobacter siberiensis]|uniref:hypothetical protein n=2 Tax=Hymenobacter siberiensis TaxID=2848396 RepID=UPI001C1E2BA8|nr:hypothetical protein [Hymenobacter siberiensis]